MNSALEPIDPANHPALSGVLAPVDDELSLTDLPVAGRIPDDLRGVYLRNGPNPRFPPLGSYTYPLDGDGMIHGVWLEDGRARYRNRFLGTTQTGPEPVPAFVQELRRLGWTEGRDVRIEYRASARRHRALSNLRGRLGRLGAGRHFGSEQSCARCAR